MVYQHVYLDFGSFMRDEELRADGSNFMDWYQRLKALLNMNNVLYVIQEPLGDKPEDSDSDSDDDYRTRQDYYIIVQCTMLYTMEPELRVHFSNTNAYDMVADLKAHFITQIRVLKYECLDEFLSKKMEENTSLQSHLAVMDEIHGRLTDDLDYWMDDSFAIDGVLRSLPLSYKDVVSSYVMRGDSITFHEFLDELRILEVEPIAGEVIDGAGIFDIHVVNVS